MTRGIIEPIDFSPESLAAARFAAELARQTAARIRLVTVLGLADLRADLKASLHGFPRVVLALGVHAVPSVRRGMVEEEIVPSIETCRPPLVAMGSRGLSRPLSIGRKTEALLSRSPVPVLVVKE